MSWVSSDLHLQASWIYLYNGLHESIIRRDYRIQMEVVISSIIYLGADVKILLLFVDKFIFF